MSTAGWVRVIARCTAEEAELVADALWQFHPPAVEESEDGPTIILTAGYPDAGVADSAAGSVRALGCSDVAVRPVDDDGLDGWRAWATVERAGPFVLVPTWLPVPDDVADQHVLRLDPGRTFGSGSHPTTRAVLGVLPRLIGPGTTVLDVGCGSGILSVAAAVLGATTVHGLDIDPGAPSATAANAEANCVARAVTVSTEPLSEVAGRGDRYDVVAANLLAPVIIELAPHLGAVVAEGGTLVLSGLLSDRWETTVDPFFSEAGWNVDQVVLLEGWAAVVLRRRPNVRGHGRHPR